MNKELTKQAIAVMQGYVDGKTIQYRYDEKQEWKTLSPFPNWNWLEADYRIKPEMVKSRRYLMHSFGNAPCISITSLEERVMDIQKMQAFIRWIDTEWQEVEI